MTRLQSYGVIWGEGVCYVSPPSLTPQVRSKIRKSFAKPLYISNAHHTNLVLCIVLRKKNKKYGVKKFTLF